MATPLPDNARELRYWIAAFGEKVPVEVIAATFHRKGPEWMWAYRGLLEMQADYINSL